MHSVTDRQTDRRTDGQQDDANSRSYCVAVRSAKTGIKPKIKKELKYSNILTVTEKTEQCLIVLIVVLINESVISVFQSNPINLFQS